MKYYYVPFIPAADINYLHLLAFYEIAEYREETKAFDTIRYASMNTLAARLPFSTSTLSRILNNESYKDFMVVDKKNRVITIQNSFPKGTKRAFVRLSAEEVNLFREKNDNLFTTYYIYLKYYCGFTNNNTDFTAKQFLSACGYSIKSKDTLDRIAEYNKLLSAKNIIKIEKYRDELGHTRNRYSFL